ncbi:hypothetical protein GCM10020254_80740 [Streptomyces goshikiensis]
MEVPGVLAVCSFRADHHRAQQRTGAPVHAFHELPVVHLAFPPRVGRGIVRRYVDVPQRDLTRVERDESGVFPGAVVGDRDAQQGVPELEEVQRAAVQRRGAGARGRGRGR